MFNVGENVFYGSMGMCRIEDIRKESFAGEKKLYYVLCPLTDMATTLYHPVDGDETRLRKPLTANEVEELLDADFRESINWINNDAARKEFFDSLIRERSHSKLLGMICLLSEKKLERIKEGKKLRATDERSLADAERIILNEFGFVTGKSDEDILKRIIR